MSKSTNMVVYFDWKTLFYIYACGKCRTQCMLPMDKSVTFTDACANEIIPSINRSFVYKAKEGRHVRIIIRLMRRLKSNLIKTLFLISSYAHILKNLWLMFTFKWQVRFQTHLVSWHNKITVLISTVYFSRLCKSIQLIQTSETSTLI